MVFKWIRAQGGVASVATRNKAKAQRIYDAIDGSGGFYKAVARDDSRSLMNIAFRTPNEDLDKRFVPRTPPFDIGGGVKAVCSIQERQFYGSHSNIMAIKVRGPKVYFRIYRTRKTGPVAKSGSFTV